MSVGTSIRQGIWIRKANLGKEPELKGWLEANQARNALDPAVLEYPRVEVLAAHTNGKTHAVMAVQPVAMLESVGLNPESSDFEVAASMVELIKATAVLASQGEIKELYFLATDENTAEGAKCLGFELLPSKVFRKRIA